MKKIFKLLCFVLITLNMNCQTLPLNSPKETNTGTYFKDMDNTLPFLESVWKGIVNNKEYTFQFSLFPHHLFSYPDGDYYYIDELMGKFKVVDLTTSQVLYNDLIITNFEDYKIRLLSYTNHNGFTFSFYDDVNHCYNVAKFSFLKNPSNPNQITYTGFEYSEYLRTDDCIYPSQLDIPMFLPKVNLVLTRQ